MKRFIAIALIGVFSCLAGYAYSSCSDKSDRVELHKNVFDLGQHMILDGVTYDVSPQYGKMVTVVYADHVRKGVSAPIVPKSNSPPSIRKL